MAQSNTNSLPSTDSSKLFWYLFWSDLKIFSINLSASSLNMISILSLFECITHSSSLCLEEIKLIAIVYWILNVSDFLRLLWYLLSMD